jgi:predicted secreted protein
MTVLLGNNYLLWVENATPGTFNYVKGQGTFNESRSPNKIDTSDKTTTGFNTSAYGNINWSATVDIRVNLPDANGYTRLETAFNAGAAIKVELRKGGTAATATDAVFAASVLGTIQSRAFNKDGTVDVKIELSLASAPTADVLA